MLHENAAFTCLQEIVRPLPDLLQDLPSTLPGSLLFGRCGAAGKGVLIRVHPAFTPFVHEHPLPHDQYQAVAIQVRMPDLPPFLLCSVYGSCIRTEQDELAKLLAPLLSGPMDVLITGDLNTTITPLDHAHSTSPPRWKWLRDHVLQHSLIDAFRIQNPHAAAFTRPPNHLFSSATRLDYTLCTPALWRALNQPTAQIHSSGPSVSDHHAISLSFTIPLLTHSTTGYHDTLSLHNITTTQAQRITLALAPLACYAQHLLDGPTLPFPDLTSFIDDTLEHLECVARSIVGKHRHAHKPSGRERTAEAALASWKAARGPHSKDALHTLSTCLTDLRKQRDHKREKRAHASLASRKGYKYALRMLSGGNDTPIPSFITTSGAIASSPSDMSRTACQAFHELGGPPTFSPDSLFAQSILHLTPQAPETLPPLPPFTLKDYVEMLPRGKPGKSPGPDGVNLFLLSLLPIPLHRLVHSALARSLTEGIPPQWKTSRIKLLYKKGDPRLPSNYRPIALMNTLNKILASHVNSHIAYYMEHGQLDPSQYGFRHHHRTTDHIFRLVAELGSNEHQTLSCFDLSKAFNTCPHSFLFDNLAHRGYHPSTVQALRDLYSDVQEFPIINGHTQHAYPMQRGVRQGCPLSPTLFALFFDPFVRHLRHRLEHLGQGPFVLLVFADDVALLSPSPLVHAEALRIFAEDGPLLGISLSPGKQEAISFGKAPHFSIRARTHSLSTYVHEGGPREVIRYLGVFFFSSSQSQHSHLSDLLISTVSSFFASLPDLTLSIKETTLLINSQLIPRLTYRCSAFVPSPQALAQVQSSIWTGLTNITPLSSITPQKARHQCISLGGLGLLHLTVHIASLFMRNLARFQLNEGPINLNELVVRSTLRPPDPSCNFSLSTSLLHACSILGLEPPASISRQTAITSFTEPFPAEEVPPPPAGSPVEPSPASGLREVLFSAPIFLYPADLIRHGKYKALQATQSLPNATHIYTDGSKTRKERAGAAIVITRDDGPHTALCQRIPLTCSYFAELLALRMAFAHIQTSPGPFVIFSDSLTLVDLMNSPPDLLAGKTYAKQLASLRTCFLQLRTRVRIAHLPSHVGFIGNEYADRFAYWASYLRMPPRRPPVTQPSLQGEPIIGNPNKEMVFSRIPQHAHTGLVPSLSFLIWKLCGPFRNLPFKWCNGLVAIEGYEPFFKLRMVQCAFCSLRHLPPHQGDPLSFLAECVYFRSRRELFHDCWPDDVAPVAKSWYASASSKQRRLYIRSLVPQELYDRLKASVSSLRPGKRPSMEVSAWCKHRAKRLLDLLPSLHEALRLFEPAYVPLQQPGIDSWASSQPTLSLPSPFQPAPPPTGIVGEPKKRKQRTEIVGEPKQKKQRTT